ncbi:DNA-binding response regulator [Paenibacillus sp. 598K]|uniref:response regulator transcription factor n=1 Tax=Paenibacillus sp. 598K TaxID=1117987 RepID=UPI000FF9E693|nr:response regulator transcription factor [Paenibacillus sp. 598K]GBF75392.1 DNA-binding response regulator [Paenibacillus sp. 598K]
MSNTRILVVDDEPDITELIELYLVREGYDVYTVDNGDGALEHARTLQPDLVLLDIQLQPYDGLHICREIRKFSAVPIIFVSCKSEDTDIIHGLSIGGDDYITKPFSPRQLVARVKAQLRRQLLLTGQAESGAARETVLTSGDLTIDLEAHSAHVAGKPVNLSTKEFNLLTHFVQHPNKAFHLDHLYELIWGTDSAGDTRTIMVHISNLRKKIEPDPAHPVYIVTVRGVGYKFIGKEG